MTIAPAAACRRLRVPFCMIVNSSLAPLNCSAYDSAFVSTDANVLVAGIIVGLIHVSSEKPLVSCSDDDEGF